MFLTKLKSCLAGLMVVAVLGAGVGSICHGTSAGETVAAQAAPGAEKPGKQLNQDVPPAKLLQEIDRLRLELEKARQDLVAAQQQIAVLKAQAELAQARAELALVNARQAEEAARKAAAPKADSPAVPVRPGDQPLPKPELPPGVSAVSPDGRTIAVGQDAGLSLLDAQTGKILFKSLGHKAAILTIAFSPDGKGLVSGAKDGRVCVWDVPTGKMTHMFVMPGGVATVQFSEDARRLIIIGADGMQTEFDRATGKELRVIPKGEQKKS
jgi:hypothetical protein